MIGLTLGLAAVAGLALAPGAGARANGFKYRVTAAEVTSDSAILWAKATKSGIAEIQLVRRGGFGSCDPDDAPANPRVRARGNNDNTVQKQVRKLDANTAYAQVEVTRNQLTVDLLDSSDQPVRDTGDSSVAGAPPCAQVVIPNR